MMKEIIENDFRRINLNLLTVFLVLYRETSITRTAEILHPGQPTISGALKRLRKIFNGYTNANPESGPHEATDAQLYGH